MFGVSWGGNLPFVLSPQRKNISREGKHYVTRASVFRISDMATNTSFQYGRKHVLPIWPQTRPRPSNMAANTSSSFQYGRKHVLLIWPQTRPRPSNMAANTSFQYGRKHVLVLLMLRSRPLGTRKFQLGDFNFRHHCVHAEVNSGGKKHGCQKEVRHIVVYCWISKTYTAAIYASCRSIWRREEMP